MKPFPQLKTQNEIEREEKREALFELVTGVISILFLVGAIIAVMNTPEILKWWNR